MSCEVIIKLQRFHLGNNKKVYNKSLSLIRGRFLLLTEFKN
jgi:hypothetical protein